MVSRLRKSFNNSTLCRLKTRTMLVFGGLFDGTTITCTGRAAELADEDLNRLTGTLFSPSMEVASIVVCLFGKPKGMKLPIQAV